MEGNPLSIILVKSDSKGDRLLFRYPYATESRHGETTHKKRKSVYALTTSDDLEPPHQMSNISHNQLTGFSDEVLSNLFAVKSDLCENKFELKVNDVRFVGHPTLVNAGSVLINIQFALRATASHSIVKCYYDLSKRLGIALRHEERRCGYVAQETKAMVTAHDEAQISPYSQILTRSALARDLRTVYEDLCAGGQVHLRVNNWIEVSFCLPHKLHPELDPDLLCIQALRPYHGLLLLFEESEILSGLSTDASPALTKILKVHSPVKSFQVLAADADIVLDHVYKIARHLVYWAKAKVIFPLCESNVYVVSPTAPLAVHSLTEAFSEKFQGTNLLTVLSDFSLPMSLGHRVSPLDNPQHNTQFIYMIVWMLQHSLLLQLHTYVHLMPSSAKMGDDDELLGDDERVVHTSEEIAMFSRLQRHFNGRHHFEEIMYLENVRRSQLLQLIDKFRNELIMRQTEDPMIANFFCSKKMQLTA
ncbi:Hypothetical predicted protein [Cloeon dipterum]|uniref:GATOR complex protein NPRL3 n=1 Tax=Cloeon dipterum TaxID=197152 RepID=A0A8S1DHH1_9INSE|nr:Hypothetical predicted protein [Cloeon dipterum]